VGVETASSQWNLANFHGVLFIDERPVFGMLVLEELRQPLEHKGVTINRAQGSLTFPASFLLVRAMKSFPW
jgi:magnesium chelatase family protein